MADRSVNLDENGIPSYDDLPLQKGAPMRAAWGLYGDKDELGTLNRLTDEIVAAAAKSEIRTGARVSLNWSLDAQSNSALFQRRLFHQDLIHKQPRTVNDDVWTFNSQISSQWDSLRHFAYQHEKLFYNGVTMENIHASVDGHKSTVNGIQGCIGIAMAEKGIVGRGILVDYHAWRLAQTDPTYADFDAFNTTPIRLADVKACLAEQGTEVKFGDILIIRSGWMVAHATKTDTELAQLRARRPDGLPHHLCGVEQSEDMLRWLWPRFAAVAGDQPSFECWPPSGEGPDGPWSLHEVLLSGWGCPIGELFDLEKLAEHCRRERRWSFFVASEPCNVPGGVAR